jgi:uncharacterized protein YjbI with pentapeptide repeats
MANESHLARLKEAPASWNGWRKEHPGTRPDLTGANLKGVDLANADLSRAKLRGANLANANLSGANLSEADLYRADLAGTDLRRANLFKAQLLRTDLRKAQLDETRLAKASLQEANLRGADLSRLDLSEVTLVLADLCDANLRGSDLRRTTLHSANLSKADLRGANLSERFLFGVNLYGANLHRANLSKAYLHQAKLNEANLIKADLSGADLQEADLSRAKLAGANLSGANLEGVSLVEADISGADLTGCRIYGVSVWGIKLERTKQQNLVITRKNEPEVVVDNIEVAHFVYILLHNHKIREIIDTVGKKGVLLLGRFTDGRIHVLDRLRERLRSLGFVPMVFNFDKPDTKDFTETVRLLANLCHFVIADITNPRSTPLELQAAVPDYMVPFAAILEKGQEPFAMFVDMQNKYDWVLEPVIVYSSVDSLLDVFEDKIVKPAQAKFKELLARRSKQLRAEEV